MQRVSKGGGGGGGDDDDSGWMFAGFSARHKIFPTKKNL